MFLGIFDGDRANTMRRRVLLVPARRRGVKVLRGRIKNLFVFKKGKRACEDTVVRSKTYYLVIVMCGMPETLKCGDAAVYFVDSLDPCR